MDPLFDGIADYHGKRNDQSWEINLPKYSGIGDEGVGRSVQAGRKVIPECQSAKVKQGLRDVVCRDAGDLTEYYDKNNSRKKRL